MENLSKKQITILNFISDEVLQKGYPPSVREIAQAVNLKSPSTVHSHLDTLEKKGYIRRDPTKPRAIELMQPSRKQPSNYLEVPILGEITAGQPIFAAENLEGMFPLPVAYVEVDNQPLFMLRIQGNSMIEAGIYHRDLVLVRKQNSAENGDIVVALLEDAATVKRFFREKSRIRLQPENKTMDPIYAKEVDILGKVTGLFRKI